MFADVTKAPQRGTYSGGKGKNDDLFAAANARPILDIALGYGARLTPESGRTEFSGPCPKCGGEDCFHVNTAKNGWFCRKCYPLERKGWKDPIDFVTYFGRTTVPDAIQQLTGRELRSWKNHAMTRNITVPVITESPLSGVEAARNDDSNNFDATYYEGRLKASQAALAGSEGEAYLKGRGLTLETAQRFGLGFDHAVAVPGTKGEQRAPAIAIPWTSGGKLSGIRYRFLTKQTNPDGKEYKQSGRGAFKGLLWGGAGLLGVAHFPGRPVERLRTLVICEGELNAMSIWQAAHLANLDVMSIGSQDTKFTAPMIAFVHRYGRVLVWMDEPDRAARVRNDLAGGGLIAGIASPEKKDANDWLQAGVLDFILAYYRIKQLSGGDTEEVKRVIFDYCDLLDRGGELCAKAHKFLGEYAGKVGVKYGRAK